MTFEKNTPPNEMIQNLYERKSVRVFEDRPIPPQAKEAILRSAQEAPSAGNQQLYAILDITDPALKKQLSVTCDNQPFIAKAPLVLLFCADCQKWYDAYTYAGCAPRKPSAGDLLLAVDDSAVAAQNAVTAAWSLGIGSCYIGDIMENCKTHQQLLKLPPYVFPAIMLVLGYPTRQQLERKKPERCALKHLVMENAYHRMDAEELRSMLQYKAGSLPYEEWLSAFCSRKYQSDFSREMGRSVEEYLDAFLNRDS